MKIEIFLSVIVTVCILGMSVKKLRGFKFNTKSLTRIGIMSAITIVLYMIKLVPFPQGGGFSLLSVLPIMVLSIVVGVEEAILCGLIVGGLKGILVPPIHPIQLPLDYFCSMMVLGFTPMFGIEKKSKLILGASIAGFLSIMCSVLSGVVFFGQYAPEGMNEWKYSIGYNFLGYGVEVLLSIIVLNLLPLRSLKQILKS